MEYKIQVFDSKNTARVFSVTARNHSKVKRQARDKSMAQGIHKVILEFGEDWIEYEKGKCYSSTLVNELD